MNPDEQRRPAGRRPLLVYIPGLDGTGQLFFKQTPGLSEHYRVVSMKFRDHGLFTYEDLADDVAAVIHREGEPSATISAESFGGGVALTFALRYPQMVDRLIIVNSFARYRRRIRIRLAAWLSAHVPLSMAWPVRKLGNIAGLLVDRVPREDRRRFLTAVRTASAEGYARRLHLISELDIEDRLAEIEAPTLLIGCGRDWLVRSVREAQLMAARLPHAQVKLFPDAGHACLVGDQVRLASIVNDWRRETEP